MSKCAFEHGDYCEALTEKQCIGCKFRKTEEQLTEGRRKAQCRLFMLPGKKLVAIRNKYYKGNKWYG